MVDRVFSILHIGRVVPLKCTGVIIDRCGLIYRASLPVILRVSNGVIGKQLVGAFKVDGLGWSLGLEVD